MGAPPDQFNQVGQNWSQPPWHPERLAELGYAPFRDMVRALLEDAGGLRIDHVIGLFRLWWIPDGMGAVEGAYVRYDHEALIGILVLEAARAGAVVIGEDLGVVEPFARDYMRERGLLGTSILWFEWGERRPAARPRGLPPALPGHRHHPRPPADRGLPRPGPRRAARTARPADPVGGGGARDRARRLDKVRCGSRSSGASSAPTPTSRSRWSRSIATCADPGADARRALADLVGDRRIINQPGTSDEYPNWRLPLAGPDGVPLPLEDVLTDERRCGSPPSCRRAGRDRRRLQGR